MTAATPDALTAPAQAPPSLFSLRGRLARAEFIARSTFCALAVALFISALSVVITLLPAGVGDTWYSVAAVAAMHVFLPLALALLAVKRLHDVGKPGWLALLLLVPIANSLFVLALWIWPGERRRNVYGDEPAEASVVMRTAAVTLPVLLAAGFLVGGAPDGSSAPSAPPVAAPASGAVSPPNALRRYSP